MQEILEEHKGKRKVRKLSLEKKKKAGKNLLDSVAHQACPRVFCQLTAK